MVRHFITTAVLICATITLPSYAHAQDNSSELKGYVPPPMFGTPRVAPPKKKSPDVPTMPKLSVPSKNIGTELDNEPLIKERVAPVIDTTKPTPAKIKPAKTKPTPIKKQIQKPIEPIKKPAAIPAKKPKVEAPKEIKETGTVEKNLVKPGLEPINLRKEEPEKKTKPKPSKPEPLQIKKSEPKDKPKPTSKGIVKGPKTMPAVKKQGVDSEVLYAPKTEKPVTLMDRAQKQNTNKDAKPVKKEISKEYPLPSFNVLADGNRKLNIIFPENVDKIQDEQTHALNEMILPILEDGKNTRIRLESFASPNTKTLNGDRRTALSRAMSVRKYLVEQGISPNRIDVRSLGSKTTVQPMDRVEIFIVK